MSLRRKWEHSEQLPHYRGRATSSCHSVHGLRGIVSLSTGITQDCPMLVHSRTPARSPRMSRRRQPRCAKKGDRITIDDIDPVKILGGPAVGPVRQRISEAFHIYREILQALICARVESGDVNSALHAELVPPHRLRDCDARSTIRVRDILLQTRFHFRNKGRP